MRENRDLKNKLNQLPKKPGVYIMRNSDCEIIYVGKAKNLRNRVRQYFDNSSNKDRKVLAMVSHIKDFEYIIVENEIEALVLESNLIKKNRPKYNIVLRDDKQYPFIKIKNEKFPRIQKVREVKEDKASYYGPYPDAYAVNDSIDFFHEIFKFRTCNLNFDKNQRLDRPCLNYYIHRCRGACIGKDNEKKYLSDISEVKNFLSGKSNKLLDDCVNKMDFMSQKLKYEQALKYRDYFRSLSVLREKQKVTDTNREDFDIIALSRSYDHVTIQVYFVRSGQIVDRQHFFMNDILQDASEQIISSFMKQFYMSITYIPKEILVQYIPSELGTILEFFKLKREINVNIHIPKLGRKKELLDMAIDNAHEMMSKFELRYQKREQTVNKPVQILKELLNLTDLSRIECYDISNTSGVYSVGSMVVFENGVAKRDQYRKFRINSVKGPNDYASLEEVLTRRLRRLNDTNENDNSSFKKRPSLIIMDGGKGQISIALKVIKNLNVDIPVAGLVKDDKHTTRALIYQNQEINIKNTPVIYKFLYSIQEEAHRFAINYHRKLMSDSMKKTELDNIKGIGEKKKKNLYEYFKSIKNIKEADVKELMKVDMIGEKQAKEIYKYFKLKG